MPKMWIVTLTKPPQINDFRADFFPRKLRYRRDALNLKREVEQKGGTAEVRREE